ncbi:MAG: triose-phosphate isomerase [Patescibacteria group bacterium]
MAKPILVANWKNYPSSLSEAQTLLKNLAKKRELYKKVSLFIAPPFPYFESVYTKGKNFGQLASQDISNLPKGTYTGDITPEILKSFGVKLSIIGHSERRALGERSRDVAEKIKVALKSGIAPLVCFGEKERDVDGEHFEFLRQNMRQFLLGLSKNEVSKIALAYEPVWAIDKSSKDAIDSRELAQTIIFIRKILSDLFSRKVAEQVPILYGGSVEPGNAMKLMETGIRGFLVGHASLNAKSFEAIAREITSK